jgi:hypothetical protein
MYFIYSDREIENEHYSDNLRDPKFLLLTEDIFSRFELSFDELHFY